MAIAGEDGLSHQQAVTLLDSAQAILRGLDWADTQLTCGSNSLAPVPAYDSITASSSFLDGSSVDASPSEAADSAAEAGFFLLILLAP